MMERKNKVHIGDSGWRAVYTDEFQVDVLSAIVSVLAKLFPQQKALIGFDNRFLSEEFAHHIAFVLESKGWQVDLISEIFPTPGVASLVRSERYDWGLMITASHNPYYYNGLKILNHHGALIDHPLVERLQNEVNQLLASEEMPSFKVGKRYLQKISAKVARQKYRDLVFRHLDVRGIVRSHLKVAWDSFGGTTTSLFPYFLDRLKIRHQPVPMVLEPTFKGRRLEPDASSLKELGKLVLKTRSMAGLATDVDGDRFSVVDETGRCLSNNILTSLMVWYLLEIRGERGTVYQTVSGSSLTQKLCNTFHVPFKVVPVGFQIMGGMMQEENNPLIGIEETGGLAYAPHLPFKDGLMAHLLVLEMLSHKKKLTTLTQHMFQKYGHFYYDRVDLKLKDGTIESWLQPELWEKALGEKIQSVSTLDGTKWTFRSGSWLLIRPSKTEPLLRIYFESENQGFVKRVQKKIQEGEG